MGVLESIDLKQKNYPYRKSFEEFYQRYEIISPIFGTQRYDQMDKGSTDFRQLSSEIIKDTLLGFGSDLYAIGNTKILMRNEIVAVLDRAKGKAVTIFNFLISFL
jgi:myosin heavy subunit